MIVDGTRWIFFLFVIKTIFNENRLFLNIHIERFHVSLRFFFISKKMNPFAEVMFSSVNFLPSSECCFFLDLRNIDTLTQSVKLNSLFFVLVYISPPSNS